MHSKFSQQDHPCQHSHAELHAAFVPHMNGCIMPKALHCALRWSTRLVCCNGGPMLQQQALPSPHVMNWLFGDKFPRIFVQQHAWSELPLLDAAQIALKLPSSQVMLQGEEDMPPKPKVTLMIPWLAKSDQKAVFPDGMSFDTPEQQEEYVRKWAEKRTGFESNFKVAFYPGRYATEKGSILPVGDPTAYISDAEVRVSLLLPCIRM